MRSGKDFETRMSIWKVREPGCYGLRDQSRAKMAKSSWAMKRAREGEREQKSFVVSFAYFDVHAYAQPLRPVFTFAIVECSKIDFMFRDELHKTNDVLMLYLRRY